jgi:hypothetical protein
VSDRKCGVRVARADQIHITALRLKKIIEGDLPMRMVRAPSIAALRVTHVVLPFESIVPTPLQSEADWSLLVAITPNKR